MSEKHMIDYLISFQHTINVTEDKVYVNDKETDIPTGTSAVDYAKEEQVSFYKRFLRNHFENLIILTGAGSSIGIGVEGKTGKTRKDLWESICNVVTEERLKKFSETIQFNYPPDGDIGDVEEMLSKAYIAKEFIKKVPDEKPADSISAIISQIQKQIVKDCTLKLPKNSPHELLLSRLTARKVKFPRVKLFTLNYDTLFEQAAHNNGNIIIDGFSFSIPRVFNGINYDYDIVIRENSRIDNEENYLPHVLHLYKPHGSLDWSLKDGRVYIDDKTEDPLIIYPKDSKYESSYEQPFFEMNSRFQQAIRSKNALLIVIGFSFYDKHIKSMILETVKSNASFRLLVVSPDITTNEHLLDFRELALTRNNVILINEDFTNFAKNYPYPDTYQNLTLKISKEDIEEKLEN